MNDFAGRSVAIVKSIMAALICGFGAFIVAGLSLSLFGDQELSQWRDFLALTVGIPGMVVGFILTFRQLCSPRGKDPFQSQLLICLVLSFGVVVAMISFGPENYAWTPSRQRLVQIGGAFLATFLLLFVVGRRLRRSGDEEQ